MEKIRKGNDIEVQWEIYAEQDGSVSPYDLTGKSISLYLKNAFGSREIVEYTIRENAVRFMFWGMEQKHLGTYSLILVENEGKEGMHTVDERHAFAIVPHTCEAGGDIEGNVEIENIVFKTNVGTLAVANVIYESEIEDKSLEMPSDVGGLARGTTVESLEGKTFSQMFDDILFPTVVPTFTAPTASISFRNYTSIKEVGSDAPDVSNFTTSYNAGAITLNGVKQNDRGGSINFANSFIYVNGNANNRTLPTKVVLGSTTYKYRAYYSEGVQPKDNKGNDYGSPLTAGYVDSSAITLNGTYPWFASTASASASNPVVKQALVAWNASVGTMNTGNFEVQPSGILPQVFKLPRRISTLKMLNPLSGEMEVVDLGDYNETTETINIGGANVTYYVYTYKGTRGSAILLAIF